MAKQTATTTSAALVLFSGGQDSATCLAWALDRFEEVETIGFEYGQRHGVEMQCRQQVRNRLKEKFPKWAARLSDDHVFDLGVLGDLGKTAMTHDQEIKMTDAGLPTTFVPGRNIMFLTTAAAFAYRRNIADLVGGMCETDYSGYPDCRADTVKAIETALNLGMDANFHVHTPLMQLDKAATWALAEVLGGGDLIDLIIEDTHTCYLGDRGQRHDWGYGCGACPACELRARGHARYCQVR